MIRYTNHEKCTGKKIVYKTLWVGDQISFMSIPEFIRKPILSNTLISYQSLNLAIKYYLFFFTLPYP